MRFNVFIRTPQGIVPFEAEAETSGRAETRVLARNTRYNRADIVRTERACRTERLEQRRRDLE